MPKKLFKPGESGSPGTMWQKGQSGNPSGRAKIPEEVKKMLKAATPDAARLLIDTMGNQKAKIETRVHCAEVVMDRVYGKATQPIDGNIDGTIIIKLSEELSDYAK